MHVNLPSSWWPSRTLLTSMTKTVCPRELRAFILVAPTARALFPLVTRSHSACLLSTSMLGSGAIMVMDETTDAVKAALRLVRFYARESCGKCTPCRIGSTRGAEVIDRLVAGQDRKKQEALLRDLCDTMTSASLCAMGGLTPLPVLSALDHFPEDFAKV